MVGKISKLGSRHQLKPLWCYCWQPRVRFVAMIKQMDNKLYGAGNISKLDSQQLKPLCCHYWQLLAALTSSLTVLQQGIYCQSQVQRNSVQFFLYSFNSLQNLFVIAERFLTVLFSLAVSSY